eukprot:scaffold105764_cov34-Phaeocystis_antarctica.AAC.1
MPKSGTIPHPHDARVWPNCGAPVHRSIDRVQRLGVLLSCHPTSRTPPSGLVGRWPLLRTF